MVICMTIDKLRILPMRAGRRSATVTHGMNSHGTPTAAITWEDSTDSEIGELSSSPPPILIAVLSITLRYSYYPKKIR